MCKAFGLTPSYVLHGISYANLHLMAATLPSVDNSNKSGGQTSGATSGQPLNGDDPASWEKIKDLQQRINKR